MKKYISIPEELLLKMYQYLVLYALLHPIGDTELFNKLLNQVEEFLPKDDK